MSILNMTLSASVMIIMIEILRVLTIRRLPKNLFRILWAVTAMRILVPFSFPFRFSAGTGLMYLAACLTGTESAAQTAQETVAGSSAQGTAAASAAADGAAGGGVADISGIFHFSDFPGGTIFFCIYLAGAAAAVLWFSAGYIRSMRLFRQSLPADSGSARCIAAKLKIRRKTEVRESEFIRSPLTYGIVRPVILLPKGISDRVTEEQLEYVFTHELVHIRRFDAVLKLLLTAALCLQWFNPLVWIMYFLADRDIELACDESVVRISGSRSGAGYASMLVSFAEFGRKSSAAAASFSRNALSERVISIMERPPATPVRAAAAAVLFAVIVAVFATSAQPSAVQNWLESSASVHAGIQNEKDAVLPADLADVPQEEKTDAEKDSGSEDADLSGASGASQGAETAVSEWNRQETGTGTNPPVRDYASQGTANSGGDTVSSDGSGSQTSVQGPSSPGNLGGYDDDVPTQGTVPDTGNTDNPLPASPGSLESYG